jgi:hypothetical protein
MNEPDPDILYLPPADPVPAELDPKATDLRQSTRIHHKLHWLVPSFDRKSYQSTAATNIDLIHPDNHMHPNYVLIVHYIMAQFSLKTGMNKFKDRGKETISKELSQLNLAYRK